MSSSTPRSSPTNKSMNQALMRKLMAKAAKGPPKSPVNKELVHKAETIVQELLADKKYRQCKPTDNIPQVAEHELHKSLGIQLSIENDTRPGWFMDADGNRFFMNEENAKKGLPNCHLGMYYLTQVRAKSRAAQKKSNHFRDDFFAAYMAQLSFVARQLGLPSPSYESETNSQAFHLYKKYLRGFSTYTPCNMQLSRVACRVAISRLGYDPTQGLWCSEADCLRYVTLSEYAKQINPEDARDTSNVSLMLLSAMLKEWMVHHGHTFASEPEAPDYTKWPVFPTDQSHSADKCLSIDKNYSAQPKPANKFATGTTMAARAKNALHAIDFKPKFDSDEEEPEPTEAIDCGTHYLVEENIARKCSLGHIFLTHGDLEVNFTTQATVETPKAASTSNKTSRKKNLEDGSKNDYLRLKSADHVACILDEYVIMAEERKKEAAAEATKGKDDKEDSEGDDDDEVASPPSSSKEGDDKTRANKKRARPDKEKNSSHKSPRRPESDDPNDPEYNLSGSDTEDELNDDPTASNREGESK